MIQYSWEKEELESITTSWIATSWLMNMKENEDINYNQTTNRKRKKKQLMRTKRNANRESVNEWKKEWKKIRGIFFIYTWTWTQIVWIAIQIIVVMEVAQISFQTEKKRNTFRWEQYSVAWNEFLVCYIH